MKIPLTKAEDKAYTFILGYLEDYGRAPSYDGIAEGLNFTKSYAQNLCNKLVKKGWLSFGPIINESYRNAKVL